MKDSPKGNLPQKEVSICNKKGKTMKHKEYDKTHPKYKEWKENVDLTDLEALARMNHPYYELEKKVADFKKSSKFKNTMTNEIKSHMVKYQNAFEEICVPMRRRAWSGKPINAQDARRVVVE